MSFWTDLRDTSGAAGTSSGTVGATSAADPFLAAMQEAKAQGFGWRAPSDQFGQEAGGPTGGIRLPSGYGVDPTPQGTYNVSQQLGGGKVLIKEYTPDGKLIDARTENTDGDGFLGKLLKIGVPAALAFAGGQALLGAGGAGAAAGGAGGAIGGADLATGLMGASELGAGTTAAGLGAGAGAAGLTGAEMAGTTLGGADLATGTMGAGAGGAAANTLAGAGAGTAAGANAGTAAGAGAGTAAGTLGGTAAGTLAGTTAGTLGGLTASNLLVPGAIAASGLLGAAASTKAAETAASSTERAAQISAEAQKAMLERQIELQQPWRQAGVNALAQMQGQTGAMPAAFTGQVDLTQDPGYAFRLSEGMKALERSAAARGGLLSGGTLKGIQRFGQDLASQEYQNAYNRALTEYNARVQREGTGYNRLASLAGVGQTATGQLAGQMGQTGANLGNLYYNAGQTAGASRASGYLGTTNALTGALGTGLNYLQNQQLLSRFPVQGANVPVTDYSVPYTPG